MNFLIVRIFTNYDITNTTELLGRSEDELMSQGIQVYFNHSGRADLVLVLYTVTTPRWVLVPDGNLIKILQEPVIHRPLTHLFTYRHSRIYNRVLTHSPNLEEPRQINSIPYLGTHVDPKIDTSNTITQKSLLLSIIASTFVKLPGHKIRTQFIDNILGFFPDLAAHTFGKGRKQELLKKIDGLHDYRFSIAIENSSLPSYITEKFYDCILAGCVPLYYGSPNISDFFPVDSFIALPINNIEECCRIIRELSEVDYERRIPALLEAQSLIREKYSLSSVILNNVSQMQNINSSKRRPIFLLRLDGIFSFVQNLGYSALPKQFLLFIRNKILTK
jgi:hypothetical protein